MSIRSKIRDEITAQKAVFDTNKIRLLRKKYQKKIQKAQKALLALEEVCPHLGSVTTHIPSSEAVVECNDCGYIFDAVEYHEHAKRTKSLRKKLKKSVDKDLKTD